MVFPILNNDKFMPMAYIVMDDDPIKLPDAPRMIITVFGDMIPLSDMSALVSPSDFAIRNYDEIVDIICDSADGLIKKEYSPLEILVIDSFSNVKMN